jgi:hypothetical protein
MYPTVIELLEAVEANLDSKVAPVVKDVSGQSALATIGHILRHVRVRVEREGQILVDEIRALRELLPVLQRDLERQGDAGVVCARLIADQLMESGPPSDRYITLLDLARQCSALREKLELALRALIEIEPARREDAEYRHIRTLIRSHISNQIEREAPLVELAFHGFGARR